MNRFVMKPMQAAAAVVAFFVMSLMALPAGNGSDNTKTIQASILTSDVISQIVEQKSNIDNAYNSPAVSQEEIKEFEDQAVMNAATKAAVEAVQKEVTVKVKIDMEHAKSQVKALEQANSKAAVKEDETPALAPAQVHETSQNTEVEALD